MPDNIFHMIAAGDIANHSGIPLCEADMSSREHALDFIIRNEAKVNCKNCLNLIETNKNLDLAKELGASEEAIEWGREWALVVARIKRQAEANQPVTLSASEVQTLLKALGHLTRAAGRSPEYQQMVGLARLFKAARG